MIISTLFLLDGMHKLNVPPIPSGSDMRLIATMALALTMGVLIAWGIAVVVGWLIPVAKVPIFLFLSLWWMWIGWHYAKARDRALEGRQNSN